MQIAEQTAKQNLGLESAPHLHAPLTTNAIMLLVLLALIPGFAVAVYFFGAGLILQFIAPRSSPPRSLPSPFRPSFPGISPWRPRSLPFSSSSTPSGGWA